MSTPEHAKVLVIDDEPDLRMLYEMSLMRAGHHVTSAGSVAQARLELRDGTFDVVVTDMRLPDGLGLDVLKTLALEKRSERCIVVTAYGSAENAVEALKSGAFDYLTKPIDIQQFRQVVASAWKAGEQRAGAPAPGPSDTGPTIDAKAGGETPTQPGHAALAKLVGESAPMRAIRAQLPKVGKSMAPVLIGGESGTGKELVARALHACSHRNAGPFIAVNCSAIPEALLESEFFGARKGAYTGATADRPGFFQAARGGTLFLDEIGDLPLSMQSKLLRVIQERSVRQVGATQEEPTDVRILSATHRNLPQMVGEGSFRQDLYYRINVIELKLPALRERPGDLALLCDALLARIAHETAQAPAQLSPQAVEALAELPLRGNVRELENILHRAVALSDGGVLELDGWSVDQAAPHADGADSQAPEDMHDLASDGVTETHAAAGPMTEIPNDLQFYLDQQERRILLRVLQETKFNRTAAAQRLGMSLRQIRYRIERLGIAVDGEPGTSGTPGGS